ncbi:MAG: hypothetical protein K2I83_04180, partial [Bacteroidales bacterium]|nr:hypothetical protein [Bacteroidales bacterium]
MKTIKYIGGFILAGVLLTWVSCNKIKDDERLVDQGVVKIESARCVLLEDYTGVRCPNCPTAAAEIKQLQAAYGSNLVVVALYPMEPLGLTRPFTGEMDLRTDAAQTYAKAFQIEDYPKGMVNRKEVLGLQAWGGDIQEVFDDTASDYVNLTATAKLNGTN